MDAAFAETLTGWRRHLHTHPEISRQERQTAAFVAGKLRDMGIPHETGIGGHGVVGTLTRGPSHGRGSNRSVGIRADMDALPIEEQSGVAYASQTPGVMHACGHDGHTASLLGAAMLLQRDTSWTGTVQLVFQPAEEGYGGASAMLKDGLLERFPMERIYGYHNWPGLEAGTLAVHEAEVMAGGSRIEITIEGGSSHAGLPHLARDPMVAAGHLIVALQSVVARNVDPLLSGVISICMVEGGVAYNQIPSKIVLRGTLRWFSHAARDVMEAGIHRVAQGVAATFAVAADVAITNELPAVVNDRAEAAMVADLIGDKGWPLRRDLPPAMTSEDFARFLHERPGAFVWIGNGPAEGGRELHNAHYDFNDAILPVAAEYLAEIAKRALQG